MGVLLVKNVLVDRDGQAVMLEAGTSVPGWAKSLVTNPKAFGDDAPVKAAPVEAPSSPVKPPESGKGSGDAAWQKYAEAIDLGTAPDAKKDEIIAAIAAKDASNDESQSKDYDELGDAELEALITDRELPSGGTRDEVIARLREIDAENEGDEENQE